MKTWAKFTTFSAARARMRRQALASIRQAPETIPGLTVLAAVLVLAFLAGIASHRRQALRDEPEAPRPTHVATGPVVQHRKIGPAEVRTDAADRVVLVRGPDARSVLLAYCSASGAKRRAVELASSSPFDTGVQLGLFWDLDVLLAVQIRQDPNTREWIAGDGSGPVATRPADRLRLSGPRFGV